MKYATTALALVLAAALPAAFAAGPENAMQAGSAEASGPSVVTDRPLQGRRLAIPLVRKTMGESQRETAAKQRVRETYGEDPQMLMQAAAMVTAEFRIIAEANDYWRERKGEDD